MAQTFQRTWLRPETPEQRLANASSGDWLRAAGLVCTSPLPGRFGAEREVQPIMDVGPIQKVFETLMTAGAALSLGATGFFIMLAGYQYLSAVPPPRAWSSDRRPGCCGYPAEPTIGDQADASCL